MYKLNNGNGAIVCDECGAIIKTGLGYKEYSNDSSGYDLCSNCTSKLHPIDNFDKILKLLEFNNKDEFYFLQIIQRKKDGNVTQVNNNGYRTIKTYYIYSKEQLLNKRNKIIELCIKNNARAYININRRNAQEVALEAIRQYGKLVYEGNAYQGYRVYDSVCGSTKARKYKALWLLDVDSKDQDYLNSIIKLTTECRGSEENKVKAIIPTISGYHLITSGFDLIQFNQKLKENSLDDISVHKDNPTLLYYAVR